MIKCPEICGAKGDRTPDLVTASHALSQLSYSPVQLISRRQYIEIIFDSNKKITKENYYSPYNK